MESIRPSDTKIQLFWTWFEHVAKRLGGNFDNQLLLDQLDEKVSEIGDISWELGPGTQAESSLTLTPDGAAEWLPVTQRAVAIAPQIAGWEFHPARRRREWDLQFSLEGSDGRLIDVDACQWRYVLLRFPEGTFDIILEQNNLLEADEEDRYSAAMILLDGILGEAKRLLTIEGIEPTEALSPEQAKKANSITVLEDHLQSLHDL